MLHTCVLYSSRIYGEVLFRVCGFGLPWEPRPSSLMWSIPPSLVTSRDGRRPHARDQPMRLAKAPARPEKASLGIRNVKSERGEGKEPQDGNERQSRGIKGVTLRACDI